MKRRAKKRPIDPWSLPSTEATEVYVVEESDYITEEIEYTLEQLRLAYEMPEEERDKIWSNHSENKDE